MDNRVYRKKADWVCEDQGKDISEDQLGEHLKTCRGNHFPEVKDLCWNSAYQCIVCHAEIELVLCACSFPVTIVCTLCYQGFHSRQVSGEHIPLPLQLITRIQDKRNYDLLLPRIKHIATIKAWISANQVKVQTIQREMEAGISSLDSQIDIWKKTLRLQFAQLEQDVVEFSQRVIWTLDQSIAAESPEQVSNIEKLNPESLADLIQIRIGNTFDISALLPPLIHLQANFPPIEHTISKQSPIALGLVSLQAKTATLYTVPNLEKTDFCVLNAVIDVDQNSCWCLLDQFSLFLSGGKRKNNAKAGVYSFETRFLTELPDMKVGRYLHAVVSAEGKIYVFGGVGAGEGSGERFDFLSNGWASLQLAKPRVGASACLCNGEIYIIAGAKSETIEKYSIDQVRSELVQVSVSGRGWTISYLWDERVFILQKDRVYELSPKSKDALKVVSSRLPGEVSNWWSPTPPIIHENSVFFLLPTGAIWTISHPTLSCTLATHTLKD